MLIIGESTQRNYMSLYGYKLPTTPHLDALASAQNLLVFNDVISPHTHTAPVLEKLLTFSNYENRATPWFEQMNLIDSMRLAGFKTAWFSNQERISIYGNVAEIIAKRADFQVFSNLNLNSDKKDGILLKIYDAAAPKLRANPANFIVFHLMGTHGGYKYRYPREFERFSAQTLREMGVDKFHTKAAERLNDFQAQTRAEYANAVLYNDFVVSEIMARFRGEDAIVFYLSDHCDEVYDYRDFAAHTWTYASRFMVEIPFVIFMSDKFKKNRPEVFTKAQNAVNKPFMSDNFIHALFDLLDLECDECDESLSLFSAKFNALRPRIVAGKDYDSELKNAELGD